MNANSGQLKAAFSDGECLREFAQLLLKMSLVTQDSLRRISQDADGFHEEGYGLLTELYGLRARSNMLYLTPSLHCVKGVSFTQAEVVKNFESICLRMEHATELKFLASLVVSVVTIASALGEGRSRVLNFLLSTLFEEVGL